MFTGWIGETGQIVAQSHAEHLRLRIAVSQDLQAARALACDGVRLTVVAQGKDPAPWVEVELSPETLSRTHFGQGTRPGQRLNLERALRLGEEMGGHIVTGHVDGLAQVLSRSDDHQITLRAPADLAPLVAAKGSVALNGVSLTVHQVQDRDFTIRLIPATLARTTLGQVAAGDRLNLEVDTLARYVARLRAMERG